MIRTLYKGSHLVASSILGGALLAALAMVLADIPQAHATLPTASATPAPAPDMLGRFVVGPHASVFIPASSADE